MLRASFAPSAAASPSAVHSRWRRTGISGQCAKDRESPLSRRRTSGAAWRASAPGRTTRRVRGLQLFRPQRCKQLLFMTVVTEEKRMCAKCAVDPVLVKIVEQGEEGHCIVCRQETMTAPISDLAEPTLAAYKTFVQPADDKLDLDDDSDNAHWLQGGNSPNEILQELLGCEPEAADVLLEELADQDWRSIKDGGDDFFSADQYGYELKAPKSDEYDRRWTAFEWSVKHEGRFFNDEQRRYLDELFAPLLHGELSEGRVPLVEIGSKGSVVTSVFRAREANEHGQRARIYEQPAREMGPPPPRLRRQGRMNAAGIGVFYGSSDTQTCIAELRVPVGGRAVVGEFTFLRPVTVLDLRELEGSRPPAGMSWLQEDFVERYAYATFMRGLHNLIRRPVLPDAESLDYLPTQIIAEYLASLVDPRIDGCSSRPRNVRAQGPRMATNRLPQMRASMSFSSPVPRSWRDMMGRQPVGWQTFVRRSSRKTTPAGG